MDRRGLADDHPVAIAARICAVAAIAATAVASLGPAQWLPRLLYSNNLEHFAAFYVLALALSAARYRSPLARVMSETALLATALEAARWLLPGPRTGNFQHWIADLGGILAAGFPTLVGTFRAAFARSRDAGDGA